MRQVRRQLLSLVLGLFVLAAAALGLAGPASAHDAAESTSPAQGAALAVPPAEVSVTFSNKPLGIGSSFSIKDAGGTEWADGSVQIVDNVATQKLRPGGPAGTYTVAWRVVSSDSHPIEGTFTFTAASGAPGAASSGTPTAGSSTAAGAVPGMGTAQPGVTEEASEPAGAGEPFQWSIVIFAVVAVGLLVALGVLARRRLTGDGDTEDDGEAGDRAAE
ncbi:copper resistance CopC family protein [Pseudarthrobacter sp902506025]|uniref:Methionine-rich copper-binding protein CopC n=1 Tax=Pseudarthrobacter defluvii TaxID=410837 RepID=A0ABT9UBM3_9MICC|nr:copper resistance CopC family protein [Pseudarthrobacter defluvii]MDQ0117036.1 methionine-rich copper-binding protein CopC [Pseudarthrobacter defluvii]